MNFPEIEHNIQKAIDNRPKITTASLNLYVLGQDIYCGSRIVMPSNSEFVTHVSPYNIENGFDEKQWKLMVNKIQSILSKQGPIQNTLESQLDGQEDCNAEDRRLDLRLNYRKPLWFAEDIRDKLLKGVMCDVSRTGMAFTCCSLEKHPPAGEQIITRFSIPEFHENGSLRTKNFEKLGHICRIEEINNALHRVAVKFSKPLPFSPAEYAQEQLIEAMNIQDSSV